MTKTARDLMTAKRAIVRRDEGPMKTHAVALNVMALCLVTAGLLLSGCNKTKARQESGSSQAKAPAAQKRSNEANDLRIPGRSVPLGRLARIDTKVLAVAELRKHLTDKGPLHFAAVLLQTPKKALECMAKQAEHHESCPPPYFTFGDTEPYSGSLPKRLGARVLVMMHPQVELEPHHTYVVLGRWCPDRNLARFCGEAIWRVPDDEGRRFWHERAEPLLPKRP